MQAYRLSVKLRCHNLAIVLLGYSSKSNRSLIHFLPFYDLERWLGSGKTRIQCRTDLKSNLRGMCSHSFFLCELKVIALLALPESCSSILWPWKMSWKCQNKTRTQCQQILRTISETGAPTPFSFYVNSRFTSRKVYRTVALGNSYTSMF